MVDSQHDRTGQVAAALEPHQEGAVMAANFGRAIS
jgi:hypothetical protein